SPATRCASDTSHGTCAATSSAAAQPAPPAPAATPAHTAASLAATPAHWPRPASATPTRPTCSACSSASDKENPMLLTTHDQHANTAHVHDAHITSILENAHGTVWVYLADGTHYTLDQAAGRDLIEALTPAKASSLAEIRRAARKSVKTLAQYRAERN